MDHTTTEALTLETISMNMQALSVIIACIFFILLFFFVLSLYLVPKLIDGFFVECGFDVGTQMKMNRTISSGIIYNLTNHMKYVKIGIAFVV